MFFGKKYTRHSSAATRGKIKITFIYNILRFDIYRPHLCYRRCCRYLQTDIEFQSLPLSVDGDSNSILLSVSDIVYHRAKSD